MNPNDQPATDQPVVDQPVSDQPAPSAAPEAPTAAEKCETCGGDSNNGNCAGCYQPNANCTCASKPAEGEDAPVAPAM